MSGHPHTGKRSEWISCKTPPQIVGWYEVHFEDDTCLVSELLCWAGSFWFDETGVWYVLDEDKWRGLAEKPE